ncbi:hypothetical protein D3C72_560680 [compost metagenome]
MPAHGREQEVRHGQRRRVGLEDVAVEDRDAGDVGLRRDLEGVALGQRELPLDAGLAHEVLNQLAFLDQAGAADAVAAQEPAHHEGVLAVEVMQNDAFEHVAVGQKGLPLLGFGLDEDLVEVVALGEVFQPLADARDVALEVQHLDAPVVVVDREGDRVSVLGDGVVERVDLAVGPALDALVERQVDHAHLLVRRLAARLGHVLRNGGLVGQGRGQQHRFGGHRRSLLGHHGAILPRLSRASPRRRPAGRPRRCGRAARCCSRPPGRSRWASPARRCAGR